ncbi:murein L,D-transpeptidase catalytic domain family protein [Pedobacter sp. MW01-1-1]|uniref:murein L,D-transpeptidase catalytic domain family protein n=1 Tax=Pedobacter sp. MW01-1-1 TaxID=3383027 RepID=UPI003FEF9F57
MRKYILGISGLLLFSLFSVLFFLNRNKHPNTDLKTNTRPTFKFAYLKYAETLYASAHLRDSGLSFPVFEKALTGYLNLKKEGRISKNGLLGIADFDQSSTKKRLYVLNLETKNLVLNTWVAHGQRSGEDDAVKFSNKNDSFTSSIGFYITAEEYKGAHGRSLKLDGMDRGYNDNARSRSIVIHGAPYVSEETISALGRLGRSQGCPAVSPKYADVLISDLGEGSVLFINKSKEKYHSTYLNEETASLAVLNEFNPVGLNQSYTLAD